MEPTQDGPTRALSAAEAAADPGHLEVGAWIGRYQVEALLGQGGMGAVYRVRDSVLERSVALKAIRLGAAGDPAMRDRFRREAMALAQLNHRNVCQVHDWVEFGGVAFIAMEYVAGRTLAETAPSLSQDAKLRTLRSIANALQAAHGKGIVHRDLKPVNIMLDSEGGVKVLDFGLARLLEPGEQVSADLPGPDSGLTWSQPEEPHRTSLLPPEADQATQAGSTDFERNSGASQRDGLTLAGAFMGSPPYASPEQIARLPVGPPSDIFSLGILAWELLLGEHPFPGKGSERLAATVAGKRRSLRDRKLHPRLAGLLRGMLARNPGERPSARQVAETLDRHLQPLPVAAWATLGVATLGVALGLGYAWHGRSIVADLIKDRPPRVVILPVRNSTSDPALGPLAEVGMTELMATALRESPNLTVVEGESVTRALSAFRLDPGKPLDREQQGRMLNALGAVLVLQGNLERDSAGALRYSYSLRTRSGSDRHSGQVSLPPGGALTAYALIDPAAGDLLRRVNPRGSAPAHGGAPPPEAFAAYSSGKALFLKGDFKGSEPLLREAALKAPAFSHAVTAYASCLRRLGREQAILVTNWAIMAARTTGDRWAEGRALGLKAYLARDRGDLAEAEQLRLTTLSLAESQRDLDGAAVASNHLGLIAAERGHDQEALIYYRRSLELARQVADQTYIALAQNNLANLALKRGDLPGATQGYRDVLATQGAMGNRFGEGLALNNLGVVALTSGNLAEADSDLNRALAIREAVGDKAGRATSLRNLGLLELMKGNLDAAEATFQRALSASQEAGIMAIEAECRFCLGDLFRLRGRLRPAQEEFHRTLAMLNAGVTPQVAAAAQAALAECEARLAPKHLDAARQRLASLPPGQGESPYTLRAWAWIYHLGGQREQALEALDRAKADPTHTAPELRRELSDLRTTFSRALN